MDDYIQVNQNASESKNEGQGNETLKRGEGFSWREDFPVGARSKADYLSSSSHNICLFICWLISGHTSGEKTASIRLATKIGFSLCVCVCLSNRKFCSSDSWKDRSEDCRAKPQVPVMIELHKRGNSRLDVASSSAQVEIQLQPENVCPPGSMVVCTVGKPPDGGDASFDVELTHLLKCC